MVKSHLINKIIKILNYPNVQFIKVLSVLKRTYFLFSSREADEISNGRKGKQVIFRSQTYFTGHGERQKEVLLLGH